MTTAPPSPDLSAVQVTCAQVRGGNRAVHAPIDLPGIRGVVYSRPCDGGRGGDVHYLSVCGSGLLSHICLADVVGHGEKVAGVSATMHALLKRSMNWTDQRRVLRELNQDLQARGELAEFLKKNPKNFSGWISSAFWAIGAQELDSAAAHLQKARDLRPNSATVGAAEGLLAAYRGEVKEAIGILRTVIAKDERSLIAAQILADIYT